jgi:hypothetical protein
MKMERKIRTHYIISSASHFHAEIVGKIRLYGQLMLNFFELEAANL